MNYDDFFKRIEQREILINVNEKNDTKSYQLSNEALFQLPLISMVLLMLAKDRRKPFVSEVGQLVGESIEKGLTGFKGSSQHLGWSANLRIRTIKALSFLECLNLIKIDNRKGRLTITELGSKVIEKAIHGDDGLAYNLAQIQKAYRNICVDKQLDLNLL